MNSIPDIVIRNIGQLITNDPDKVNNDNILGVEQDVAIALKNNKFHGINKDNDIPPQWLKASQIIDVNKKVVSPGLIDPHTHLIFAGQRAEEFSLRLKGVPYIEILKKGGGILATVKATRKATEEKLIDLASERLNRMLSFGVTTCEIKSGYGLDTENELKILRVANRLKTVQQVRITPTFLGAHAFPPEYRCGREEKYVSLIINEMLPQIKKEKLADACDIFLDEGVFNIKQALKIFDAAMKNGFKIKLHAGQFNDLGGQSLAANIGALSVDHLEKFSIEGLKAMAEKNVIATLLPGAALSLNINYPDANTIKKAGVKIALATDCNPGTSCTENLPLMATLGVTRMGLTVEEAWKAITINAAKAAGMENEVGIISFGRDADFVIWNFDSYFVLPYHFGVSLAEEVYIKGRNVWRKS